MMPTAELLVVETGNHKISRLPQAAEYQEEPHKEKVTVLKLDFGPEIGGNFASPLGGILGPKAARGPRAGRRRSPAISDPPATAAPRSRST